MYSGLGKVLNWSINQWVALSGKKHLFMQQPWLDGPMGDSALIGDKWYSHYATSQGLVADAPAGAGLVTDFSTAIPDNDPNKHRLLPEVAAFYEHTAAYKLEVWSQWYAPYALFARLLIKSVSVKMNQLNIPLEPLETSRGMSNEVIHLRHPADGRLVHACWLRKSIRSGKVVYSGFYSTVVIGGRPFVRVVFPLPGGNATVILRCEVQADGSVKLISDGRRFGDAGYYRVRKAGNDGARVKYVPIKETIHVYKDASGVLRTDHFFGFLGSRLLELHYKIGNAG